VSEKVQRPGSGSSKVLSSNWADWAGGLRWGGGGVSFSMKPWQSQWKWPVKGVLQEEGSLPAGGEEAEGRHGPEGGGTGRAGCCGETPREGPGGGAVCGAEPPRGGTDGGAVCGAELPRAGTDGGAVCGAEPRRAGTDGGAVCGAEPPPSGDR